MVKGAAQPSLGGSHAIAERIISAVTMKRWVTSHRRLFGLPMFTVVPHRGHR